MIGVIAWRLWAYADQLRASKDVTEYLKLPIAPFVFGLSVLAGLATLAEIYRLIRPIPGTAATTS
jgi:hypothetical protein